jgi:hypothetical protein
MKILVSILHGSMFPSRYDNVIKTWGKDIDHIFYSDHEDLEKNIIRVSEKTHYHSNEEKHINALKYVNDNKPDYDWFFFCDDDTFVNVNNLIEYTKTANDAMVHGSVLKKTWPSDLNLVYCSGGAGYLISKKILSEVCKKIDVTNIGYSDVTLGYKLRDLGILSVDDFRFKSQNPSFYNLKINECCDYITFHYIKHFDEMDKLYNSCK